jgi:hypothetical protein
VVPDRVRLVADPGLPYELALRVADVLPWEVSVECRRLPVDDMGSILVPAPLATGDEIAVALTDHPRRDHLRPILAELDPVALTGIVSLPSLGARRLLPRAVETIQRVVEELRGATSEDRLGPFPRELGETTRFVTASRHGLLRILAGMVRANRPWRLARHLSKAFAAAVGVLAYAMLDTTIWSMGRSLPAWRLALVFALAVGCMVGWLIVDHDMWERPRAADDRALARLFNAATVTTLVVGVLFLYAGLLALGLAADRMVLDGHVLSSITRHDATLQEHLAIICLSASIGTIAGAVGTGFESDEAVRQAAYGFRQRERLLRRADRGSEDEG